jgi:hypothetical protein
VYWQGKPAKISAQDIRTLRESLVGATDVRLEKYDLQQGDHIVLKNKVFYDEPAQVVSAAKKELVLYLPQLQIQLSIKYSNLVYE